MMIIVNRIGDNINGSFNGTPFAIAFNEITYDRMKDLQKQANEVKTMEEMTQVLELFEPLTKESYKELVETATPYLSVNKTTGRFYLRFKDGSHDNQYVPKALVDRIIQGVEDKMDILPLIKCWIWFRANPNFSAKKAKRFSNYINKTYTNYELVAKLENEGVSRKLAIERATGWQTPITEEGLLNTYKVSEEITTKWVLDATAPGGKKQVSRFEEQIDEVSGLITYKEPDHVEERVFQPAVQRQSYDAFYCGDKLGHIIKVGSYHRLERWDQVNTNDDSSCVKGLHVGNIEYIRCYQHEGTVTHNVFVNPMHIGAITDDGSGALRVLGYFVHSTLTMVNRGIYHSSTYAAMTQAEFQAMLEKIKIDAAERVVETSENADILDKLSSY